MEVDYKFSKADLAEFKKFWESETGKKYIKKMEETKDQLLQSAMGTPIPEQSMYHAAIANGFDSILKDIDMTIKGYDEGNKKENKPKSKK